MSASNNITSHDEQALHLSILRDAAEQFVTAFDNFLYFEGEKRPVATTLTDLVLQAEKVEKVLIGKP